MRIPAPAGDGNQIIDYIRQLIGGGTAPNSALGGGPQNPLAPGAQLQFPNINFGAQYGPPDLGQFDIFDDLVDKPHLYEAKNDIALQYKKRLPVDSLYFSGDLLGKTVEEIFADQTAAKAQKDAQAVVDGTADDDEVDTALENLRQMMEGGPAKIERPNVNPIGAAASGIASAFNPEFAFDIGAVPGDLAEEERKRLQGEEDQRYKGRVDSAELGYKHAVGERNRDDAQKQQAHEERVQRARDANARFFQANVPGEASAAARDYNEAIDGLPGYSPIPDDIIKQAEDGKLAEADRKDLQEARLWESKILFDNEVKIRGGKLNDNDIAAIHASIDALPANIKRFIDKSRFSRERFREYFPTVQQAFDRIEDSRRGQVFTQLDRQLKPIWSRIYSVGDAGAVFEDLKRARDITKAALGSINDPLLDGSDDELRKAAADIVNNPSRQQEMLDNQLLMAPLQRRALQLQIDFNNIRNSYAKGNAELDKKIKEANLAKALTAAAKQPATEDEKAMTKYAAEQQKSASGLAALINAAEKSTGPQKQQALQRLAAYAGVPMSLLGFDGGAAFLEQMKAMRDNFQSVHDSVIAEINAKNGAAPSAAPKNTGGSGRGTSGGNEWHR